MTIPHNIYIHVPYCVSKCNYCAFFSHACAQPDWDGYSDKIISEIDYWSNFLGKIFVPTIFFGGGTPSLMPNKTFDKIISHLKSSFDISPNCEITIESNPGTLTPSKLDDFIKSGITRLSIGIQSFDDRRLKFLGRRHSASDALRLLDTALSRSIRVSGDFIYGLPGDTVTDIINLCHRINATGLKHASLYELTIEPNTVFGAQNLNMPTNSQMAEMYDAIAETLSLSRYEVSNYSAPDQECIHNQNVWDGGAYIGLGPGSAGRVFIDDTWYEQSGNGERFIPMTNSERATEKVITGLRQTRGAKLTPDVLDIIDKDYIKSHPDLLYIANSNRIIATPKGMLILDEILLNLVK